MNSARCRGPIADGIAGGFDRNSFFIEKCKRPPQDVGIHSSPRRYNIVSVRCVCTGFLSRLHRGFPPLPPPFFAVWIVVFPRLSATPTVRLPRIPPEYPPSSPSSPVRSILTLFMIFWCIGASLFAFLGQLLLHLDVNRSVSILLHSFVISGCPLIIANQPLRADLVPRSKARGVSWGMARFWCADTFWPAHRDRSLHLCSGQSRIPSYCLFFSPQLPFFSSLRQRPLPSGFLPIF